MNKLECLFGRHKFEIRIKCFNLNKDSLLCSVCKCHAIQADISPRSSNHYIVQQMRKRRHIFKAIEWWDSKGQGGIFVRNKWVYFWDLKTKRK